MFHCVDWYTRTFRDNLSVRSSKVNEQRHSFWTAWSLTMGPKFWPEKLVKKTTNLRRVKALKSDDFIQNSAEVWNPKCIRAKLFPRHYTAPVKRNKRVGRAPTATELGLDDRRTIIPFPVRKSGLLVLENIQNVTGAQPGSFTKFE